MLMNPTFDSFLSIPTASNSILEQTMSRTLPQIPDPLPATLTNADDEKIQRLDCVQGVECGPVLGLQPAARRWRRKISIILACCCCLAGEDKT